MDLKLIKAAVIGDGCLCNGRQKQGYINYRFSCTHSSKQKDYLLWKKDLLAAAGLATWYSEFENVTNPHTGKRGLMCRIESPVDSRLTVLYGQMYPKSEGFKPGVLDDIDELGLAIIFMDDGGKQVNKVTSVYPNGKRTQIPCVPYIGSFRLALQSHGWSGAEQFRDWLLSRFGVHASICSQNGSPVLSICRMADKERFRSIVSPSIHPCVAYKVDGSFQMTHLAHRERLSERGPYGAMRQSELAGNEPREGEPKSLPASV